MERAYLRPPRAPATARRRYATTSRRPHDTHDALIRHPVLAIGLALCVSLAALFLLLAWLSATRWFVAAAVVSLLGVLAGHALGVRVWPWLGGKTAMLVLRAYAAHAERKGIRLVLGAHPDFMPTRLRRAWEAMVFASVVAFVAASGVVVASGGGTRALPAFAVGAFVVCSSLTFLLVPHWIFARLGLRMWQPRLFLARSVATSYARLVKVGNGTILLAALAYALQTLARSAEGADGYIAALWTFLALFALSATCFVTAAIQYGRREPAVLHEVAAQAQRLGFMRTSGALTL